MSNKEIIKKGEDNHSEVFLPSCVKAHGAFATLLGRENTRLSITTCYIGNVGILFWFRSNY